MSLSLTPLPSDRRAADLLPNTDPVSGIVTFTARPSRHAWAISQTVLHAIGARSDVFGAGRRHGEDLTYLHAWLHAYDTRLVVVRHATMLQSRDLLDNLLHTVTAVGAHLAVTCDDIIVGALDDWVADRSGQTHTDLRPLQQQIATLARPVPPLGNNAAPFPQYLPRVDFYGFRARCREVLTPDEFAQVDDLYCSIFRTVRGAPFSTPTNAAAGLAGLLAHHATPGEAVVIARAAQAAMFTHGLLLKVWLPTLLNGVSDADHRRLTPAEVRSLRAYRTTWRSSAIVLADADLSADEISGLILDQVAPDGTLHAVEHLTMHPDARVFLRAQRQYRTLNGATPSDPFITETTRYVAKAIRMGGTELNLPSPGAHQKNHERKTDKWHTDLGVTLLPLVTAHLPKAA